MGDRTILNDTEPDWETLNETDDKWTQIIYQRKYFLIPDLVHSTKNWTTDRELSQSIAAQAISPMASMVLPLNKIHIKHTKLSVFNIIGQRTDCKALLGNC